MARLRLARLDDATAIAEIYAPYVRETIVSFELEPPSAADLAERIAGVTSFYPWLVLEADGRVRAYAYATRLRARPAYDWIAESSVYVARELLGRGLGEVIYRALLDLLALQGVLWAYGAIALPNPGSQRFHARLGFEHVGRFPEVGYKHGRWCDIDWWRVRLAQSPAAGQAPAPVRSIHCQTLREPIQQRLARAHSDQS